jgi:GH25 family lysozyme M1 (1,4-beta-N-acetylmuramidase)
VKVTAAPVAATLKIDQTAVSLAVGDSKTIKAESNQAAVVWEITDKNAEFADVTVSSDGKTVTVKGKKAGTIKLTATVKGSDVQPQTCTVTITDSTVTPDKTSVQVAVKKTVDINVATRPDNITITAESSRKDIATVAVSGKKVTVTGVKIGESIVTIKGSNGKEAKVTVKVVGGYEEDTTSLLKDKDGNQVYVLENGKYREAVYADYYKTDMQYFLKTEGILYTGWQNIDGKTYYYLENHQYVTGEQVIQGAKYNFASDGSLVTSSGTFGIDVSKWNGNIDWNSVKASGASYAIIRCGYRGSSTGALITDPKFAANISGANAAGMKVGVYFFTQAVNEKEAVEEASMVLDLVKKYKISYPIFLDVESSGGRADGIDKGTRTAVCKAFCATIQNSGYTAGVYANKTWLNNKIDAGALGSYKIWLAQYAAAPTYNGRYNLWQYSSKGSVPGIKGNVDLNLSFLGY